MHTQNPNFPGAPPHRDPVAENRRREALWRTDALQNVIINNANFSSIATAAQGVVRNAYSLLLASK